MDFNKIDWNAMWLKEFSASHWSKSKVSRKELWDQRAASFDQGLGRRAEAKEGLDKEDYVLQMLDRIEVKPDWSILDIGSGPGTLTIPLAKKARSVTALDLSSEMLKHLKENVAKNGLNNISYINASWLDACADGQVEKHDVVVASRSLMFVDMKKSLSHIINAARQAAYLTFPVIHLPFDWEVYKVIGREGKRHPPYVYIYNLLFQMGIQANVEILRTRIKVRFTGIEEAVKRLEWRTEPFTTEEKSRLVQFLEKKFIESKETGVLTHEGYSKWALIWWRTEKEKI
jgi:predicted TPR repeat methyltransferase